MDNDFPSFLLFNNHNYTNVKKRFFFNDLYFECLRLEKSGDRLHLPIELRMKKLIIVFFFNNNPGKLCNRCLTENN